MKVEELRIGNWIKDGHEFNPIPLTEEWLLKFGFKKISEIGDYSNGNMTVILAISNKIYTLKRKRINHVHQLQNLYFALTGEELTLKK